MTAPAGLIAGAGWYLVAFNAVFAVFLLDRRSADLQRAGRRLYRLSLFQHRDALDRRLRRHASANHTAISSQTVEVLPGSFRMSLMTGFDLRPFSRPTPAVVRQQSGDLEP